MGKDELILKFSDDLKGLHVLLYALATDYSHGCPIKDMEKALFLLADILKLAFKEFVLLY